MFSKGLKNEFETAVVNEPSVFELLKFYFNLTIFGRYNYHVMPKVFRMEMIWYSEFVILFP